MPTTPDTVALAAFATRPATEPISNPCPPDVLEPAPAESTILDDTPTPNISELTPRRAGFSVINRWRTVRREVKSLEC